MTMFATRKDYLAWIDAEVAKIVAEFETPAATAEAELARLQAGLTARTMQANDLTPQLTGLAAAALTDDNAMVKYVNSRALSLNLAQVIAAGKELVKDAANTAFQLRMTAHSAQTNARISVVKNYQYPLETDMEGPLETHRGLIDGLKRKLDIRGDYPFAQFEAIAPAFRQYLDGDWLRWRTADGQAAFKQAWWKCSDLMKLEPEIYERNYVGGLPPLPKPGRYSISEADLDTMRARIAALQPTVPVPGVPTAATAPSQAA